MRSPGRELLGRGAGICRRVVAGKSSRSLNLLQRLCGYGLLVPSSMKKAAT